jgi:Na+/H+ antiporter NhaD/arsenite permease-like protein
MAAWIAGLTFVVVIGLIVSDRLNLTVAAFLGAMVLVFTKVLSLPQAVEHIAAAHSTLALFFGVMVMVRVLQPTGVFAWLASRMVMAAQGRGDRLLLAVVLFTSLICAVLPNATTVMLVGPTLVALAMELGIEVAPLLILLVLTANSSGLLTLVGDPATFIVGRAAGLDFPTYLSRYSFGGVLAILTVLLTLPWLWSPLWRRSLPSVEALPPLPPLRREPLLPLGGLILAVLTFFVIGELLPLKLSPDAVALGGAAIALGLSERYGLGTVPEVLSDVDWGTLLFFICSFVLIGGLKDTGVISTLGEQISVVLQGNTSLGVLLLIWGAGLLSSVIPNIPLVIALVPILQSLAPTGDLSLYGALMFGGTLGGNATLVGASANIVAAGIATQAKSRISFRSFLRYGVPVTVLQLAAVTLWLLVRPVGAS